MSGGGVGGKAWGGGGVPLLQGGLGGGGALYRPWGGGGERGETVQKPRARAPHSGRIVIEKYKRTAESHSLASAPFYSFDGAIAQKRVRIGNALPIQFFRITPVIGPRC